MPWSCWLISGATIPLLLPRPFGGVIGYASSWKGYLLAGWFPVVMKTSELPL